MQVGIPTRQPLCCCRSASARAPRWGLAARGRRLQASRLPDGSGIRPLLDRVFALVVANNKVYGLGVIHQFIMFH